MDSVTQFVLGGAMGELVLGRRIGRLAPVLGGICATLPDLDVFYSFGDPVSDFTYHRSATHSIFVLAIAAPVVAELLRLVFRRWHEGRLGWYMFAWLVLLTHPVLDCFTTYGTQILWPLSDTPVSWSTIFIIDPAYTLPLLVAVIWLLAISKANPRRMAINVTAILLSSTYLGWTVYAKGQAETAAETAIAEAGLTPDAVKTIPGPFTSTLWRITAVDDASYHDAWFSVFDPREHTPDFVSYDRNLELLEGIEETWAVQRLVWFTGELYKVGSLGNSITISDLRMGVEPAYAFNFKVGTRGNPHTVELSPPQQFAIERDLSVIKWAWARIFDPQMPTAP